MYNNDSDDDVDDTMRMGERDDDDDDDDMKMGCIDLTEVVMVTVDIYLRACI